MDLILAQQRIEMWSLCEHNNEYLSSLKGQVFPAHPSKHKLYIVNIRSAECRKTDPSLRAPPPPVSNQRYVKCKLPSLFNFYYPIS